ncbi:YciI family protein [Geodermatophilus maliterrae]|uniref:YciI family protein n=1 Tax=Geodermatophilus maliterrae TaxID=3162531 RepID=A0ABV3XAI5_9ACTN
MRYLILIQSNPRSREVWEGLSDEQRAAFGRAHLALTDELVGTGELVVSEGLPDPSAATLVSVRDGRTLTSDGPFAEAKEYLAGFYLVDVAGLDRAVEIAARAPDAATGSVEVRPVHDLGQFDL